MKRVFIILSILLISIGEIWGQSIWTKITTTDNWDNDGVYWLTQTTKSGQTTYYYVWESIIKQEGTPSDNIYNSYKGKKYTFNKVTINIIPNIHLFRIIKVSNDEWYIYDINEQRYLTDNGTGKYWNYIALEKDRIKGRNNVKISFSNGLMDILFPASNYLRCKDNFMRLYVDTNKDAKAPIVYKLKDFTTLDAMSDLPSKEGTSQVIMYRNFEEDLYNTLILPCNVSDYQTTFGSGVKAYELTKIDDKNLTIVEKKDNRLEAKKPYLLKGNFNKSPYLLGNQEISYEGSDPITNVEGGEVHGVFATREVPEWAYFIYENKFYTYDTSYFNANMTISPYKWYIPMAPATSQGKKAKSLGISEFIDNTSTSIISTSLENNDKTAIYSLTGQRMKENTPLPRGIYIKNGRKWRNY